MRGECPRRSLFTRAHGCHPAVAAANLRAAVPIARTPAHRPARRDRRLSPQLERARAARWPHFAESLMRHQFDRPRSARPYGVPSLAALATLATMLLLPLAAGCSRQAPTQPLTHARAAVSPDAAALSTTGEPVHLEGEIGPGALYSLDRPADWNGDLVIYLHGYTNPAFPVALPNNSATRDALLAAGFAVAASSYSSNGYALPEAVRQSHQLRGLFVSRVAPPQRTFILGVSLGGIAGLKLAETYPGQYDGALLVSGVVGGSAAEVQYLSDAKVLFDQLYPAVHLGGLFTPIPVTDFN